MDEIVFRTTSASTRGSFREVQRSEELSDTTTLDTAGSTAGGAGGDGTGRGLKSGRNRHFGAGPRDRPGLGETRDQAHTHRDSTPAEEIAAPEDER